MGVSAGCRSPSEWIIERTNQERTTDFAQSAIRALPENLTFRHRITWLAGLIHSVAKAFMCRSYWFFL